jgi:hypothetical protein
MSLSLAISLTAFVFFSLRTARAALMTLVTSFTKSYREAQTYLTSVFLVPTLPVAFNQDILVSLRIGVFLLNMYKAKWGSGLASRRWLAMTHSSHPRANLLVFLAVLALSALTMVWLFWRHPLKTLIFTIVVLAALGVSARLARAIDTESSSELGQGK